MGTGLVAEQFEISRRRVQQLAKPYREIGEIPHLETPGRRSYAEYPDDFYEITIAGDALDEEGWRQVEAAMAERAVFAAQLLVEQMPADIEEAFEACEYSLFPDSYSDMATNCTCPNSANPCKHLAAVFYIPAEKFDDDPFLIFT
ncbi:SWIM zinc finger family protein [Halococcus sediminicola]|uniref:SWIM zinc finger family protein n=1 Tax=Halococcus sediminicola TaxID=1264579 RepID=UPI0006797658|nr:SWIM zinc finger family protein [Halococcus sediminicola]